MPRYCLFFLETLSYAQFQFFYICLGFLGPPLALFKLWSRVKPTSLLSSGLPDREAWWKTGRFAVHAHINYSEHVLALYTLYSWTYSSYAILGNCTDSCPAFSSPYFQAHSGVSCKFLILLKLLLGWKRNSPPFMLVSCTNQDAGFLLVQCIWPLVFTRQGEEMLLWHKNAIVFLPMWGNISESNCDLGVIKSSMCLWHLLLTLFESYHFPPNDRWNVITSIPSLISAPH